METDLAVLNTWFDAGDLDNNAATQKRLCKPSLGDGYGDIFGGWCGVNNDGSWGDTEVCPDDILYVQYALANYGNTTLETTQELWFSTNDWLNTTAGVDVQSPTIRYRTLNPEESFREGRIYYVPSTVEYDTEYYVIINVETDGVEESTQNNWIPLRGTIWVKSRLQCNGPFREWP